MRRSVLPCFLLLVASRASAAWTAEWSSTWQHPEPLHAATEAAVLRGADGAVFAAVHVVHHATGHATLVRFDADGAFEWLRESVGGETIAMTELAGARTVVVDGDGGDGATIRIRAYEGASGDPAWSDTTRTGRFGRGARRVARSSDGGLLVGSSSGGDVVVLRYTAAGVPLPDWHWSSGQPFVCADDLVALPDGGAVVAGRGVAIGGGYLAVRFDADGKVVFTDREDGDLGNPLGLARVEPAADGIVFAGAPESSSGVFQARVWKVRADGERAWTRVAPNPAGPLASLDVAGLVVHDADVFAAIAGPPQEGFRLLRLDAADGSVREDANAIVTGTPTDLVRTPAGRLLVGGFDFADSMGHVAARMAEFDAGGRPCRASDALGYASGVAAVADGAGWLTLGTSAWSNGSSDALVARYDAEGTCDRGDAIFADGFDPPVAAARSKRPNR